MLSFATEFPVDPNQGTRSFLEAMVKWVGGSPHTKLSLEKLQEIQREKNTSITVDNESVQSLTATAEDLELAGFRYGRRDHDLNWLTTIVFSKTSADAWVGIRVECESQHPSARLPSAKNRLLYGPCWRRSVVQMMARYPSGIMHITSQTMILTLLRD